MDTRKQDEGYLGSGLDVSFDGWRIILQRDGGDHCVALDPQTYTALVRYAERINGKYNNSLFR